MPWIFIGKIAVIVILALILLAVFAYHTYMLIDMLGKKAPYVGSYNRHLHVMQNTLKLKTGSRLVDLGCGDGKAMRFFEKNFDLASIDGYEINRLAVVWGKVLNFFLHSKIHILAKNFSHAEIKNYDYIYVYLLPDQLADIEDRLFIQLTTDAIVIANSFQFSDHKPFKIINDQKGRKTIFLYKK